MFSFTKRHALEIKAYYWWPIAILGSQGWYYSMLSLKMILYFMDWKMKCKTKIGKCAFSGIQTKPDNKIVKICYLPRTAEQYQIP